MNSGPVTQSISPLPALRIRCFTRYRIEVGGFTGCAALELAHRCDDPSRDRRRAGSASRQQWGGHGGATTRPGNADGNAAVAAPLYPQGARDLYSRQNVEESHATYTY